VERNLRLGELTVWEDGAAHMVVLDLHSGVIVFERDGVSLASAPPEVTLKDFFDRLDFADRAQPA